MQPIEPESSSVSPRQNWFEDEDRFFPVTRISASTREVLRNVVVMRARAAGQFNGLADVGERCIFIKGAGTKRLKSSREGSQHSSRKASIILYSLSN
jgi:hypothetical protein